MVDACFRGCFDSLLETLPIVSSGADFFYDSESSSSVEMLMAVKCFSLFVLGSVCWMISHVLLLSFEFYWISLVSLDIVVYASLTRSSIPSMRMLTSLLLYWLSRAPGPGEKLGKCSTVARFSALLALMGYNAWTRNLGLRPALKPSPVFRAKASADIEVSASVPSSEAFPPKSLVILI